MTTTTKTPLQLDELLAILDFVKVFVGDKHEYREYLKDIVITDNKVYACNGHMLGVITLTEDNTTGIDKRVSIDSVVNSIKVKKDLLEVSNSSQSYPDIDRLIPKTETFEKCAINTFYLGTVFTALSKLQKKIGTKKFITTTISSTSASNANVFEAKLVNKEGNHIADVKIIIMPVRL